ncbi:hypothetical protein G7Y89_g9965 [Cudoniella acicularis]|uniref:Uncharacterized protein n=1 Tax=Cudoniella acicularis TaxID=354080 RepID=A0A8H4RDN5_9HELO|nr:hypothetical protein G7Y89_g9965 [Cudoniella acicularis]
MAANHVSTARSGHSGVSTEKLLSTAHGFIDALSSLDVDRMLALRTSDCQQVILPASLGREPLSNEEFRAMYSGYLTKAKFSDYTIKVLSSAVDPIQKKVVLYGKGEATTLAGPFKSEYVFLLTMVEENNDEIRISKVEEFVDSNLSIQEGGTFDVVLLQRGIEGATLD